MSDEIVIEVQTVSEVVAVRDVVQVVTEGIQGPAGPEGPEGDPGPQGPEGPPGSGGGIEQLADDPSPELGGDLNLGAYNIIGQLENDQFILDGGLLG